MVQVKMLPTPEQATALEATPRMVNLAANHASKVAFERNARRHYDLRKLTYGTVREEFGLAAQASQHAIKKVADAYTALKGNLRAGNLGPEGSPRRARAESKPITFRPDSAHPYDDRRLTWNHDAHTVSIWTTAGRLRNVAFTGFADQLKVLTAHRKGESDLVHRDGMWFLYATCDLPDVPIADPTTFVGVDLGIAAIATTSDGTLYAGKAHNAMRHRHRELRGRLQAKNTKSANDSSNGAPAKRPASPPTPTTSSANAS
ncbi:hypothetical protein HerbRD11066_69750 [Herbidospora sp. RD11066]